MKTLEQTEIFLSSTFYTAVLLTNHLSVIFLHFSWTNWSKAGIVRQQSQWNSEKKTNGWEVAQLWKGSMKITYTDDTSLDQCFTWLMMNLLGIFFLNFWWLAKARTTMKFVRIPTHPIQICAIVTTPSGGSPSSAWSFENPTSDVPLLNKLVGLVSSVLCSIVVTRVC